MGHEQLIISNENTGFPADDFFEGFDTGIQSNPITIISANVIRYEFWEFKVSKNRRKDELGVQLAGISQQVVLRMLNELGFYKRLDEKRNMVFIQEHNNVLSIVNVPHIKDVFVKTFINPISDNLILPVQGSTYEFTPDALKGKYFDTFHLLFNEPFLHHLPEHTKAILKDNKDYSIFFFEDCIVKTSQSGWNIMQYNELGDSCIWEAHIIKSKFLYDSEKKVSHFSQFIINVSNNDEARINACYSGLGYLLHSHNKATGGQVVVLYDEKPSKKGKPEGGTGKGLFVNAIKQLRTTAKIDGKKYRSDDKFKWQSVKQTTQLVWLDDVNSKFPFEDLHSNSTDGWNVERKHEAEFYIPPHDSHKIVIASNTVLASGGTTNKRRQFIVEFSDYYSRHIINGTEEPIRNHHGCTFFDADDWDMTEWNRFFSFMIDCSVYYHKNGLQSYELKSVILNQIIQSTSDDFAEWIQSGGVVIGEKYKLKALFDEFKESYHLEDTDITQSTFSRWLKSYASIADLKLEKTNSSNVQFIVFVKVVKK
jgi:arginine repressor